MTAAPSRSDAAADVATAAGTGDTVSLAADPRFDTVIRRRPTRAKSYARYLATLLTPKVARQWR